MSATFAADASADCTQTDLEGRWRVYATVTDQSSVMSWMNCAITVSSKGAISDGACQGPGQPKVKITSGEIFAADTVNCAYSGRFELEGTPNIVNHATLSPEKTSASGVGSWTEGFFTFTMIKIHTP